LCAILTGKRTAVRS
jgi:CheY-like chemotaxis protein